MRTGVCADSLLAIGATTNDSSVIGRNRRPVWSGEYSSTFWRYSVKYRNIENTEAARVNEAICAPAKAGRWNSLGSSMGRKLRFVRRVCVRVVGFDGVEGPVEVLGRGGRRRGRPARSRSYERPANARAAVIRSGGVGWLNSAR